MPETIFLTAQEALDAVCTDFRQYDPQLMLFGEVIRLISGGKTVFRKDTEKAGAWVSLEGEARMPWLEGPGLVEFMCRAIRESKPDPELLASICMRVFRTRARAHADPESGHAGVVIQTGMEGFLCRQCGRCCNSLIYHDQLLEDDVKMWEEAGRRDILQWVGVFEEKEGKRTYRIWTEPGIM